MKRIALIALMMLLTLGASARSIHYFTYSQATRTVDYLNRQNELMIYCGYDYEIETYVLISDVWMERVNSSYYEIWLYGYDAYTGDEIYMPLDLQCVWLFSGSQMYNAAQYLRFRVSVSRPSMTWHVPHYHPFTRVAHHPTYSRTYHYDVHRHGWRPPHPTPRHNEPPLPPYYMRQPNTTPPAPSAPWTPGREKPVVAHVDRGGSVPSAQPSSTGSATRATTAGAGSTTRGVNADNGGSKGSATRATTASGSTTRGTTAGAGSTTRGSNTPAQPNDKQGDRTTNASSTTRSSGSGSTTPSGSTVRTRTTTTTTTEAPATRSSDNTNATRTGSSTRSSDNKNATRTGSSTRSGNTTTTTPTRTGNNTTATPTPTGNATRTTTPSTSTTRSTTPTATKTESTQSSTRTSANRATTTGERSRR